MSNYLIESYGRPGVIVTVAQVAEVRRGGPSSYLMALARTGVAAAMIAVFLLFIIVVVKTKGRRTLSS
jgi:hypothetical protein